MITFWCAANYTFIQNKMSVGRVVFDTTEYKIGLDTNTVLDHTERYRKCSKVL